MSPSKIIVLMLTVATALILNGFVPVSTDNATPAPITRSTTIDKNGKKAIKTEVLFNKTTTREDVIHTCNFLAREDVQLTFESLQIRKSFFGVFGRARIAYAKGMIELPGGSFQNFKAGGAIAFKSIKITYSQNSETQNYLINMIEIID